MKYRVLFYETERGRAPAEDFYNSLHLKERAKIAKWIEKLEVYGPDLPRPYADIVKGKIRELRIRYGKVRYRFFFFFNGKDIIITHGIKKKTDTIPDTEIRRAETIRLNFLSRLEKE